MRPIWNYSSILQSTINLPFNRISLCERLSVSHTAHLINPAEMGGGDLSVLYTRRGIILHATSVRENRQNRYHGPPCGIDWLCA